MQDGEKITAIFVPSSSQHEYHQNLTLLSIGYEVGVVSEDRMQGMLQMENWIADGKALLQLVRLSLLPISVSLSLAD